MARIFSAKSEHKKFVGLQMQGKTFVLYLNEMPTDISHWLSNIPIFFKAKHFRKI